MRKWVSFLLVFQLSLGLSYLSTPIARSQDAGDERISSDSTRSQLSDAIRSGLTDPEIREHLKRVEEVASAIEEGRTHELTPEQRDAFHLRGQRLEIYKRGETSTYELSQFNEVLPKVAFTSLDIVADREQREIRINAVRGGEVVASHVISDVEVAALAWDRELIQYVDKKGRMHAMDFGYVAKHAFGNPLPTFRNLHEPVGESNLKGEIKASFLTRGLKPFQNLVEGAPNSVLLPRGLSGSPELQAGDFVVFREEGGRRELLGIYSRDVTYGKIEKGTAILAWLSFLVSPETADPKAVETLLTVLEGSPEGRKQAAREQKVLLPEVRDALIAVKGENLRALMERVGANQGLSDRNFDRFTLEEWLEGFQQRQAEAERQLSEAREKGELSAPYQKLESEKNSDDYRRHWKHLTPGGPPVEYSQGTLGGKLKAFLKAHPLKILASIAALGGGAALYYQGLQGNGPVEVVHAVNFIHENWMPAVLKDAEYRVPLLFSVVSLMAFIPEAMLVSWTSIPFMKKVSKLVGGKWGVYLREKVAVWEKLNVWERIASAGARVWAVLSYPFWNYCAKLLRQPNFFNTLKAGVNPLKKAGKHGPRIGVNNPFLNSKAMGVNFEKQQKALGAIGRQSIRARSLAWLLATVVVSGNSGIDPATLSMLANGAVELEELQSLLRNPKKQREWRHTSEAIYARLRALGTLNVETDLKSINPEELAEYFRIAKEEAKKVAERSRAGTVINELRLQFRSHSRAARRKTLGWAEREYEFLRTVYANDFTSTQLMQEFTLDHAVVVGMPAVIGERANLANPKELTASKRGVLWTNGEHLYDVALNTMAHFFASGAQLMLVYQGEPNVVEDNYLPEERVTLQSLPRREGFFRSAFHWIKDVLNVPLANIGGVVIRGLKSRLATIQASLIMGLSARQLLADQPLPEAFKAWVFVWGFGVWWFGFVWYPVQRGNQIMKQRIAADNERLMQAKERISQGLRLNDEKLLNRGYDELLRLYDDNNRDLERELSKQVEALEARLGVAAEARLKGEIPVGALARLVVELAEKKSDEELRKAYDELVRELVNRGHSQEQLRKLTARSLLQFAMMDSPVYSEANPKVSITSVGFAVWLSTLLAISLSVASFEPDVLTWKNIMRYLAISAGLYVGVWGLFSAKAYSFYAPPIKRAVARVRSSFKGAVFKNRMRRGAKGRLQLSCRQAFAM